jgi:hypothetical protein
MKPALQTRSGILLATIVVAFAMSSIIIVPTIAVANPPLLGKLNGCVNSDFQPTFCEDIVIIQ